MNLHKKLNQIFELVDLKYIDSLKFSNFKKKPIKAIAKLFPTWKQVLMDGFKQNSSETERTLRHILRAIKIYFLILKGDLVSNLSYRLDKTNLESLREDLKYIRTKYGDLFLLLLLFHDIGRPFNREWHNIESVKILESREILTRKLNKHVMHLLKAVIRNHLLLGTIFTGESSYLGAKDLIFDENFKKFTKCDTDVTDFFLILRAFTIIDILGYSYGQIYDHYFQYYEKIAENLTMVFLKSQNMSFNASKKRIIKSLQTIDTKNIKWRISCSLRIFQHVSTQKHLTESFYYTKIDEAFQNMETNWKSFQQEIIKYHSFIQFKYALPIMMMLSSGKFNREAPSKEEKINNKIFDFWKICCEIVKKITSEKKSAKKDESLFYFVFHLPRMWFLDEEFKKLVRSQQFLKIIEKSKENITKYHNNFLIDIRP